MRHHHRARKVQTMSWCFHAQAVDRDASVLYIGPACLHQIALRRSLMNVGHPLCSIFLWGLPQRKTPVFRRLLVRAAGVRFRPACLLDKPCRIGFVYGNPDFEAFRHADRLHAGVIKR